MKKRDTFYLIFLFILIVLAMLLSSCKTKYVTVPEVRTQYVSRTDSVMVRDSIFVHDSVEVKMRGDTVVLERWHKEYVNRWRDRMKTDTVHETDSIPYPVEVIKEVSRELTWWQKTRMHGGEALMGIMGVLGVVGVLRLKKKWWPL